MRWTISLVLLLLVFLPGCFGTSGTVEQKQEPPVVNNYLPKSDAELNEVKKGLTDVRQDIASSSNQTANQLSGLVNASISKLGEQVKGIEANFQDLLKVVVTLQANFTANFNTEFKAKVDATANAVANLSAQMTNVVTLQNKIDKIQTDVTANVGLARDLKTEIGEIKLKVNDVAGAANAQIGFNNKFDQRLDHVEQTMNAGRDVNMLPMQAVYVIIGEGVLFVIIIIVLALIAGWVILKSEQAKTMGAEQERKKYQGMTMKALAMLPEKQACVIARDLRLDLPETENEDRPTPS